MQMQARGRTGDSGIHSPGVPIRLQVARDGRFAAIVYPCSDSANNFQGWLDGPIEITCLGYNLTLLGGGMPVAAR